MSEVQEFKLSGVAIPHDAAGMLDEICEHFVEHSSVERTGNLALLRSETALVAIRLKDSRLLIELACATEQALQLTCNNIAEHLVYFAGEEPLELSWSTPPAPGILPDLREVTVVSAADVTPHMRRVKFSCEDIAPFIGGGMHVRVLLPPDGRIPVWPTLLPDGRTGWPEGEDELAVRVYTIRSVDVARRELWIDFLQHATHGVAAPGAEFARKARPGQKLAFLGPGGGGVPQASSMLLAGDATALPAIARIAAEVPAHIRMQAIILVEDAGEEQPLPTSGTLDVRWLHRKDDKSDTGYRFGDAVRTAISAADAQTYVWVACERDEMRPIRALLKQKGHDRKLTYAAWYWEKPKPDAVNQP
ncbi:MULTISPECIES: DUF2218 domain-containing protein [Rhizobium]|uniref:DUF2218 domain-containing protein n=1 Tax=Rhizobium rhododendri TaxID=2506430 RepID=A0ABY8IP23_9HYPH|nr:MULTISPECIES: DUF2218 domain-containing protein [Rhizobium]QXZ81077.1 DUF2218 domain-containing protein [Rhizobium sp. L51/94]TQX84835.1 DUF2218 domain-containing protein [Rhizobium sp. rho-13.1]TQY08885.1 DUF2218 domain-containing protein [Rhizobium sp. rho-1.1]WFS25367.1 DUF2218 domain-containing protein [Rhizobium rhododendri]